MAYHFLALGPDTSNGTPIPCTASIESQCEYIFFHGAGVFGVGGHASPRTSGWPPSGTS